MEKKGTLTKVLAIVGTVLAWFPLLALVLASAAVLLRGRVFHFDYLMPAELFPFALAGGVLLLWQRSGRVRAGAHRLGPCHRDSRTVWRTSARSRHRIGLR